MKRIFIYSLAIFALLSCNPNSGVIGFPPSPAGGSSPTPTPTPTPTPSTSITDIFVLPSATAVPGEFPESTAQLPLSNFSANNWVLNGGSLYVSYTTDIGPHQIYVGAEGIDGYYVITPEQGEGNEWHFVLVISSDMNFENLVIIIAIVTSDGQVGEATQAPVEVKAAGSGLLQISLSFDNEKDVDLHLLEPNGGHIFFGNRRSSNGGFLDIDSNAGCTIDGVNNENIYYQDGATIEAGTYKVYALMYSNCDTSIPTNCIVTVFYNGEILNIAGQTNPAYKTFPVGATNEGSNYVDVEPILTFEITPEMAIEGSNTFEPVEPTASAIRKLSNK